MNPGESFFELLLEGMPKEELFIFTQVFIFKGR
jgi:hypothetical protein